MKPFKTNDPEVKKIALTAFPHYKGRKFKVKDFYPGKRLDSYWDGGSKDTFAVVELSSLRSIPLPNTWAMGSTGQPQADQLPEGLCLVEHSIFCGKDVGITLHLNDANLQKFLTT